MLRWLVNNNIYLCAKTIGYAGDIQRYFSQNFEIIQNTDINMNEDGVD